MDFYNSDIHEPTHTAATPIGAFFFFFITAEIKTQSAVHHLVMPWKSRREVAIWKREQQFGSDMHLIVCLQDLHPNSPVAYRTCPGSGNRQDGEKEKREGASRCTQVSEAANTIQLFLAVVEQMN